MMNKCQWTPDEDLKLIASISIHGPQQWTYLARSAGLQRSGKSCRLRWLNYLRPDVKRGNLTLHEHILILQLHCQFGNRWSKIAQHLPGRTDNEIKNYWRTRVEKLAKQHFNCHANSLQFREAILHVCLPMLTHRLQHSPQEEELAVSDHEKLITTSTRVQPTTGVHDQILEEDYYCGGVNNYSPTGYNSPGSEVANPLNGSSWITTRNLDSYNHNQYGTPTMLSKYTHEQPVSQISHLSLPSTATTSSEQADYFQPPPTSTGNIPTTTTATISATGSIPAGEVHGFDDYGDIQYYYCCSSWWLGDGGGVDSGHHCYYSSSF